MTDRPTGDEHVYDDWIANRRAVEPPSELTDRVMALVEKQNLSGSRSLGLVESLNESPLLRVAACFVSSLVGSLPFLYAAYVAQLLAF